MYSTVWPQSNIYNFSFDKCDDINSSKKKFNFLVNPTQTNKIEF